MEADGRRVEVPVIVIPAAVVAESDPQTRAWVARPRHADRDDRASRSGYQRRASMGEDVDPLVIRDLPVRVGVDVRTTDSAGAGPARRGVVADVVGAADGKDAHARWAGDRRRHARNLIVEKGSGVRSWAGVLEVRRVLSAGAEVSRAA